LRLLMHALLEDTLELLAGHITRKEADQLIAPLQIHGSAGCI
jgi:hypothetical protein